MSEQQSWAELVKPIVRKCRLAAMLKMETRFNADGAAALAKVIEDMANIIDTEIAVRSAANTAFEILGERP
jgi:hypothetical protein